MLGVVKSGSSAVHPATSVLTTFAAPTDCDETLPRPTCDHRLSALQLGMAWFAEQPGGLDRYYADLIANAAGVGLDVRGLVAGTEGINRDTGGRVAAFAPAASSLWSRWRGARAATIAVMADRAPDVVASHFALYAFPILKLIAGLPHVVHFHGPWAAESRAEGAGRISIFAKHAIERKVYRSATRCIALSNAFAQILHRSYGVDPSRIRVVPGGVDTQRFNAPMTRAQARDELGWPLDRRILFCVRRLTRRMGLENLIDAFVQVRRECPDCLLMMAGRGPLHDELRQRIHRADLGGFVHLLGFVSDDRLPLMYRAADLSIVPSVALEGFGLTTVESLAAGTPVLVTPVGGLPEVIEDLSPQAVLPDTSTRAIGNAITAWRNAELTLPSADQCRAFARQRYDWSIIAARVREVYSEAVEVFSRTH